MADENPDACHDHQRHHWEDSRRGYAGDDQHTLGGRRLSDELAEWYRNPITGEWPRLDSKDFTPGGVYIRELSLDEVRRLAQWDTTLTGLITTKKMTLSSGETGEGVLLGKVYYYRFYGETGLLKEGMTYVFAPARQ